MESDQNLVFDFVSLFAPILLTLVTCITVFHKLKIRWPLKVNCWFCNKNTKIWRRDLNWWLCPSCEQYNGFSKDGDYTYDIPEQYTIVNKYTRYCSLTKQSNANNTSLKNNLCANCNEQENLKLLELSSFEPKKEKLYDTEIKAFKEHLELKYPLCGNCKSLVQKVLNKQALWLTRYKMLFFKQKPIKAVINNAKKSETIFRIIAIVLDSITAYNHDIIWLPIGGLFFHLCACWASLIKKKNSDMLLIFLWICIIILVGIKNLAILQTVWLTAEHIIEYHMIIICAFIIVFISIKPKSHKNTLTGLVAFKKIKLHTQDDVAFEPIYNNDMLNDINNSNESTIYTSNKPFSNEIKPRSVITSQELSKPIINVAKNKSPINSVFLNKNNPSDSYYLNDSLSILSKLSLSEELPKYNEKASHIFERKIYNTTNSDLLFKRYNTTLNRKYILSPPKLKSVMQTSWVAGGYWQEAMNTPTLSRSSSQSSGFGSVGSNFASSRETSVHEFDRCSIMSDATQSCHTPRSNFASSMRSFCRRNSPVPYVQSQNTLHDVRNCSQQFLSSPLQTYNTNAGEQHIQDYVRPDRDEKNPVPIFPSHTTIVTSPTWLSALLCGSLILNMIVLCITLLY